MAKTVENLNSKSVLPIFLVKDLTTPPPLPPGCQKCENSGKIRGPPEDPYGPSTTHKGPKK